MPGTVTMYSTTWCGHLHHRGQMDRAGIAYNEINIEQDPESAAFVEKANGGNQTGPNRAVRGRLDAHQPFAGAGQAEDRRVSGSSSECPRRLPRQVTGLVLESDWRTAPVV